MLIPRLSEPDGRDAPPGTWFALPLEDGRWAVGLVARSSPGFSYGLLYAFGPARQTRPGAAEVAGLTAADADFVAQCELGALAEAQWPVIHADHPFGPAVWPTLRVVRRALGANRLFELEWVDGNRLSHPLGKISDQEAAAYPPDTWYGPEGYVIDVSERLDARLPPSQRPSDEPPPPSLFHEDDAADWLAEELLPADTLDPVHTMLATGRRGRQPLGIAVELRVLAAAEVVAAAAGHPAAPPDPDIADWLDRVAPTIDQDTLDRARQAITRLLAQPGDLTEALENSPTHTSLVEDLQARLAAASSPPT